MRNSISCRFFARYALFCDPVNRLGGEKMSYPLPTYQALKGMMESIYWKPTFDWVIDQVRVMNPIRFEDKGIRPIIYGGGNTLSIYSYLCDVEYQVSAHFEWNLNREELAVDRNENKHYFMAKRFLERGGRRDIFFGVRECQGYVEPCVFGEGEGAYDATEELAFGNMFHGFTYPDEAVREEEKGMLTARFWSPVMKRGVIQMLPPEECKIRRPLRKMAGTEFSEEKGNFSGLREFGGDEYGLVE